MRAALAATLLLGSIAAGGCGSLLPNHAKTHYLLLDLRDGMAQPLQPPPSRLRAAQRSAHASVATAATDARAAIDATRAPAVLISVNPASTLYEGAGIVFSRGPLERAYYQFASWSERPSRRLGLMVEHRLVKAVANGAPLSSVALDTSGVRGDWLLGVRLVDLYHDTSTQPHRAVVTVEFELIDWERRRMIERTVFSATNPLRAEDAESAVIAMNHGMMSVLDQLEEWIERKALETTTSNAGRTRPH